MSLLTGEFAPLTSVVRPTTLLEPELLRRATGIDLILASETFQHTGSFKFRAAYNVAAHVPEPRVITASSGNFGQAMAYACSLTGKSCIVVMPNTSASVKIEAVRAYGGEVDLIDVCEISRADRVAELAEQYPGSYVASAYDDTLVIAGNATLGDELADLNPVPEVVVAPVGGGGLTSGLIIGLRRSGCRAQVVGAEPAMANDAAESLRAGHIMKNAREPMTIADGARTVSVGTENWKVLQEGLTAIVEVPEETILEAVRLLFLKANLKCEPTGALSLAAVLTDPDRFAGKRVCCVVSGGNVDPAVYRNILA
jgi:threonine dehydratase